MTSRWLCWLTFRHRGKVGYVNGIGPYWMCDNCGEVATRADERGETVSEAVRRFLVRYSKEKR